jgi:hypothetical protein
LPGGAAVIRDDDVRTPAFVLVGLVGARPHPMVTGDQQPARGELNAVARAGGIPRPFRPSRQVSPPARQLRHRPGWSQPDVTFEQPLRISDSPPTRVLAEPATRSCLCSIHHRTGCAGHASLLATTCVSLRYGRRRRCAGRAGRSARIG